MSILHVNQIKAKVKELFENNIDCSDINETDSERENKIATRCLAAYGVFLTTGCSLDEASESVTDSPEDNGIDAIYHSSTTRNLIIVQSKFIQNGKGGATVDEMQKFIKGVKDLVNLKFERFNSKIQEKKPIIESALMEFSCINMVWVDTGNEKKLHHAKDILDDFLKEVNDPGGGASEDLVKFNRYNQKKLHESLKDYVGKSPIELELWLQQWGKIENPQLAYFGSLSGEVIGDWWKKYGRSLFERNLRQVLGKTEVNEEIKNTIKNEPENFWYFNNGITIVANHLTKSSAFAGSRDFGQFMLSGAQIVNGAQTVSSIGDLFLEGDYSLDQVLVGAKVISLENAPPEFGSHVTRTNNRQNRIENRDFVAQDANQKRIQTELAIEGVEYNIVRSDSFQASENAFDLYEATIALACTTSNSAFAVQSKKEIGKFFENIEGSYYKTLFNPNTNGMFVYNSVRLYRFLDQQVKNEVKKLNRKTGRWYGLLTHGNRIVALHFFDKLPFKFHDLCSISFKYDSGVLAEIASKAINDVYQCVEHNYPDNMLGTLFKNFTKCRDIYKNCLYNK